MTEMLVGEGKIHTAGPWSVSGVRSKLDGQPYLFVLRPDGRSVAAIPYSDRTNQDHIASHADARLIAAAPDMLAALLQATSRADKDLKEHFRGRTDQCALDYAMCMDAIRKATEPRP